MAFYVFSPDSMVETTFEALKLHVIVYYIFCYSNRRGSGDPIDSFDKRSVRLAGKPIYNPPERRELGASRRRGTARYDGQATNTTIRYRCLKRIGKDLI